MATADGQTGDGPAPPLRLFISYARADAARAQPLMQALEAEGFAIWWDGLLQGGENFLPATEAALNGADAVVVLWSATSVASHWVRDEATVGRDRRRLVPITLDGTMAPLGFRQFQTIDMTGWDGSATSQAFRQVAAAVRSVAGETVAPVPRAIPPADPAPQSPATAATPAAAASKPSRRTLLAGGAALLAAGGGSAVWRWRASGTDVAVPVARSIAVLPFRNLSGDAAQDYLAEGLAEELRATLSLNRQLLVSGAGSTAAVRKDEDDPRKVAKALGVGFVLAGSLRRTADTFRVTARLVDGGSGFERWSQTFERTAADVLAVEMEIATTVADALLSTLARDSGWQAARPGSTRDAVAFDAYARGQSLYAGSNGAEDDRAALAAYDQAIARDPQYAAAHAARARTLGWMANNEPAGPIMQGLRRDALAAARTAVALAPDMAEGHAALGYLLLNQLDFVAADQPYQRSFELGFGNAPILSAYAEYSCNVGDIANARKAIARAQQLDPLNSSIVRNGATVALSARDLATARRMAQTALSLTPRMALAHKILGDILVSQGKLAEAMAEFRQEPSRLSRLRGLAIAEAGAISPAAGEARLAEMIAAFGDNCLYQQALVQAQWGRRDAAFAALDKAMAVADSGLVLMRTDILLDPVRQDPRFAALLNRLGNVRA